MVYLMTVFPVKLITVFSVQDYLFFVAHGMMVVGVLTRLNGLNVRLAKGACLPVSYSPVVGSSQNLDFSRNSVDDVS